MQIETMTKEEIAEVLARNTDPTRPDAMLFALMAADTPAFVIDFQATKVAAYNMADTIHWLGGAADGAPAHDAHRVEVVAEIEKLKEHLAVLEAKVVDAFYALAQCDCPVCTEAKQQMAGRRGEN